MLRQQNPKLYYKEIKRSLNLHKESYLAIKFAYDNTNNDDIPQYM